MTIVLNYVNYVYQISIFSVLKMLKCACTRIFLNVKQAVNM